MRAAASPPNQPRPSNSGASDRAAQLRRHREELELALREGLSLIEARRRLHAQRMAEIEARRLSRFGRPASIPDSAPTERPTPWYQREDL